MHIIFCKPVTFYFLFQLDMVPFCTCLQLLLLGFLVFVLYRKRHHVVLDLFFMMSDADLDARATVRWTVSKFLENKLAMYKLVLKARIAMRGKRDSETAISIGEALDLTKQRKMAWTFHNRTLNPKSVEERNWYETAKRARKSIWSTGRSSWRCRCKEMMETQGFKYISHAECKRAIT